MHRLFVMGVDSLFTDDLPELRHLPAFSEVLGRAAVFEDVECVYPTLTYVCHASVMSGCWPDRHGVPHNQVLDPPTGDRDWYWGYSAMRVPTVFDWAKRAGLSTAAVGWPVTAGAEPIDSCVPEVWEADPEVVCSGERLSASLDEIYGGACTGGGYALYEAHKGMLRNNATPWLDEFDIACVEDLIMHERPDMLFTHQAQLDHARHESGVLAPEAFEAIRMHDALLGRCIRAMKEAGTYDDTVIVVLGDHGHLRVDYRLSPNVLLARAGLIDVDKRGVPTGWRAYVQSCGVSGQLFARDESALAAAREALRPLVIDGLVADVFEKGELRERFHLDGDFSLMVEAAPNYGIGGECVGDLVTPAGSEDYRYAVSTHGHLPFRGPKPPFVVAGPGVVPGRFAGARLVDEAPTMMALAGIPFDAAALDGEDLLAEGSRAVRAPTSEFARG